jgi:hypothetical protein
MMNHIINNLRVQISHIYYIEYAEQLSKLLLPLISAKPLGFLTIDRCCGVDANFV